MGNEIFEEMNKDEFPLEVKSRVDSFLKLIEYYTHPGSGFLEIGTGNGYIADQLKKGYRNVVKTDFYPAADDVEFLDITKSNECKHAHVIIMAHVLEHFKDTKHILRNVSELGAHRHLLFIAVPNASFPNDGHQPYNADLGHAAYFTPYNMIYQLEQANYTVLQLAEIDHGTGHHELYAVATFNGLEG